MNPGGAPTVVVVRRLAPGDLVHYKALRDAALAAHPHAFSSDAGEARAQNSDSYLPRLGVQRPADGHFTLGAWEGSDLVGAIGCERDLRSKVRHIGHIAGMMVRADRQARGIGRALLERCIAEARATQGLEMLTLNVTAGNLPAIRLYEGAGFVRYGSLPRAIKVDGEAFAKDQMVLTM